MASGGPGKTYEMLWDCRYCGTRKNLGRTHRCCPQCGAPQDATARYFPAESEKVAVEDHVFVGADLQCSGCGNWNGRASQCCGNCGAPIQAGKEVQRRQDQIAGPGGFQGETAAQAKQELLARAQLYAAHGGPGVPPPQGAFGAPAGAPPGFEGGPAPGHFHPHQALGAAGTAKPGLSRGAMAGLGCGIVAVLVLGLLLVAALWTKEASFAITGHTWTREIAIESMQSVRDSAWCDAMPGDARDVSRSREVRSHNKVRSGETCSNRRVDNGDGTYKEQRECSPTYRDEPVHDQKCTYTVDRWRAARSARAEGGLDKEPTWPPIALACTGARVGCEREGARTEKYVVQVKDEESGEKEECAFDQAKWRRFPAGKKVKAQVRVLTDGVECDSLIP